jgi:uncharacterized membrane protein YdbT with pleckstrin-like domain
VSYIDNNLMPGEKVVARAQLHWIIYSAPVTWFCAGLGFFILGRGDTELGGAFSGFMVGACFLLAVVTGIAAYISRVTSEFGVTNKRVLIKTGFIRRKSLEVLLTKVEGIQVDQDISGRILGYGSVVVTGTGGSRDPYHRIAEPLNFRRKVQEQVAAMQEAA